MKLVHKTLNPLYERHDFRCPGQWEDSKQEMFVIKLTSDRAYLCASWKNSWWICQRLKCDVLFHPMLSLVNVAKSHWDAGTVSMWVKSCSSRLCFSVLLGVGYSALMLVEVVPASWTWLSVLITATSADLFHLTPILTSLFFMLLWMFCCLTFAVNQTGSFYTGKDTAITFKRSKIIICFKH